MEVHELQIGSKVAGVVTRIDSRGAWVTLIITRHEVLLRIDQVATTRVTNITDHLKEGDRVEAKVIGGRWPNERYLSRRALLLPELPPYGTEVEGTVVRVEDFGAFVKVLEQDILLPIGEIAWEHDVDIKAQFKEGQPIKAQLIKGRPPHDYALSIKRLKPRPSAPVDPRLLPGARVSGVVAQMWLAGNGATVMLDRLITNDGEEELPQIRWRLQKRDIAEEFVYDARDYLQEGGRVQGQIVKDRRTGEPILSLKPLPAGRVMREFAYLGENYDASLMRLADMAQRANEHWDYYDQQTGGVPILDEYIRHTFAKVYSEGEVRLHEHWAAFNTGLMTDSYYEIFGLFSRTPRKRPEWHFQGFYPRPSREMMAFRDDLPRPANYVGTNHAHMMYDLGLQLEPLSHHILVERGWRLPPELEHADLGYKGQVLEAAITQALHRVRLNFKTAIPQWYLGRLGLLLPLRLTPDQRKTDVALPVMRERTPAGQEFYRGSTVLPLAWAYRYARLIARPDPEWLMPVAPQAPDENQADVA
ncbi:MAG TPA: DUF3825 domain-containing protein [Candidatus Dormibacteraeota bacterium]|jgi:predicted RNA-binding protein with RPS1 domain|nr:DUF3825 domain-containing protein [Candidatus Dormibacteraeota bacterium]